MKAMLLAAGLGVRMRPLSGLRAKAALPVLNRPLAQWTLECLARNGVKHVVVNLHHRPASVTAALGDGSAFGLRVVYSREHRLLGTGGGPRQVRSFFGDAPFFVVNGDVWFDFDLRRLMARHRASGALATLALKPNPAPRIYSPVITGRGGRVRSIAGRPRREAGLVSLFTGVHVLDPALLDRLEPGPSDSVLDLYVPLLAEGQPLAGVRVEGPWHDLGSPERYLRTQMKLLSGLRGGRGPGLVDGSAVVDPGARVVGSVVGPGCRIATGAHVRDCVLWDRVSVGVGARLRGSVLASRVRVPPRAAIRGRVGVWRGGRPRWTAL
jgi:NDP-sugar pyrophosphorylase family protein